MDTKSVGFDRTLKRYWLDATFDWVAEGLSRQEIRARLDRLLENELKGGGYNSGRGKTMTVLVRIWAAPAPHLLGLRDRAVGILRSGDIQDRLPFHWGMCLANYPFFRDVAETAGRLLRLNGQVAVAQIQRRMCESYGDRETVSRATGMVLRSMREWGVLTDVDDGDLGKVIAKPVTHSVALWLLEALLLAGHTSTGMLDAITDHPAMFPFVIDSAQIRVGDVGERLVLHRQGSGGDVVMVRDSR